MVKYIDKIEKKNARKEEPLDLSKYIDKVDKEQARKDILRDITNIMKLIRIKKELEKLRENIDDMSIIPIIRLQRAPEIRVRIVRLDKSVNPELIKKLIRKSKKKE